MHVHCIQLSRSKRLGIIIAISFSFFVAEVSIGFWTHSIALVADAFHYLNDLIGFAVALVALKISQRESSPGALSFGWQRATLLGAFFNGVFLLALGLSIFLQSIERFISLQRVENPKLVLVVGCIGLSLNIICGLFLHEHDHGHGHGHGGGSMHSHAEGIESEAVQELSELPDHPHHNHRHVATVAEKKGHDLGMLGVLVHVIGDALNNIGVIIAATVIWKARYEGRYYADPGASMGIALMILLSAVPLVRNSGFILLQSTPLGVNIEDIKHDLEQIDGIASVHEIHAWRLSQDKAIAHAHVVTNDDSLARFLEKAKLINECLHAYGIHSTTLQPELLRPSVESDSLSESGLLRRRTNASSVCQVTCGDLCAPLTCCA